LLYRVIFASDVADLSAVSIAQILGASVANNRRDDVTGCMAIRDGRVVQVVEGSRLDLDRLMDRVRADRRHSGLRVLSDAPVVGRRMNHPLTLCGDPAELLELVEVSPPSWTAARTGASASQLQDA